MKVIGIGIDLVQVSRVDELLRRWGTRFLEKVFTEAEQQEGLERAAPPRHFAARFAVKEALLKALGTGMRAELRWKDMETRCGALGKPVLHLSGGVLTRAEGLGVGEALVSISHDGDYAIAQVLLQGTEVP